MNSDVSRREETAPIILLIFISIVRPFVPRSLVWGLAILQLVLLIRAIPRLDWNAIHLGILLCSLTVFSVIPSTRRWPWMLLIPVLLYWALVQSFRPLRLTAAWLRVGRPTLPIWIAAATVAVVSAACLVLWFKLARPDVKWQAGLDSHMVSWKTRASGCRICTVQRSDGGDDLAWCCLPRPRTNGITDCPSGADTGSIVWGCSSARVSQWKRRDIACISLRSDTWHATRPDASLLVPFVTHAVTDFSIFEILLYLAHD